MYPTLVATMLSTGAMLLTSGDKSRGHRNALLITFATGIPATILTRPFNCIKLESLEHWIHSGDGRALSARGRVDGLLRARDHRGRALFVSQDTAPRVGSSHQRADSPPRRGDGPPGEPAVIVYPAVSS